jgi:hypothetical protein
MEWRRRTISLLASLRQSDIDPSSFVGGALQMRRKNHRLSSCAAAHSSSFRGKEIDFSAQTRLELSPKR